MSKEETQKQIQESRKAFFEYLSSQMVDYLKILTTECILRECPEVVQEISKDAILIRSFLGAIQTNGTPEEVVFVARDGNKLSFMEAKSLDDNSLVNLLLDTRNSFNKSQQ